MTGLRLYLLLLALGLGVACPSLRAQIYIDASVKLPTAGSSDESVVGTCTAYLQPATTVLGSGDWEEPYLYIGVYVQSCTLYTPGNGQTSCPGNGYLGGAATSSCSPNAESSAEPGAYQVQGIVDLYNWYDNLGVNGSGSGWGLCTNANYPYDDPIDYYDEGPYSCTNALACANNGYTLNGTCVNVNGFADILEISTPDYNWGGQMSVAVSPTSKTLNPGATQQFTATVTNGSGATVTWTQSNSTGTISTTTGTISGSPGTTTTTYTAPATESSQSSVTLTATAENSAGVQVSADANITVSIPTPTISSIMPASWSAGSTFTLTIAGSNFFANTQVSISSPSWTINSSCSYVSATSITCTVAIPANTANVGTSQGATITVTTGYASSTYPSTGTITVAPIVYTYSIALLTSTTSLTYGSTSTITPVVTCKIANGAACPGNVLNPQTANFKILSGTGTLSKTTNAASTVFTDTALIGYPAQNATVQGCATVATTVCMSTNFMLPATSISLMPPTVSTPLTGGKTQAFSASIMNEGTATSLTWTLTPSPSSAAAGALTSATTTITEQGSPASGASSNTYTAPNPITTAASVTLNVCLTAKTSICATPVVIQLPGFSLTATNNNASQTALSLGHSMSYTIKASALDGFSGTIALAVSGLPAGVTAALSSPSITTSSSGSVTLTLTSAYKSTTYIGNSTVKVTGTSGGATQSPQFTLTTRPLQYKGTCGVT